MHFPSKSSNGISLVPLESKLLLGRTIFIEGEITQEMACEFVKQMILLSRENEKRPIKILINSPGGEINAGLLMYDIIQASSVPIQTYCLGRAYSMAAILFMSGNNGRYMLENSELMLHEPLVETRIGGSSSSIRSISDTLQKTQQFLIGIIAKHTGQPDEKIAETISFDHYFSSKESIDFGLCDGLVDYRELIRED